MVVVNLAQQALAPHVLAQSILGLETAETLSGALWAALTDSTGLPLLLTSARLGGMALVTPLFSSRLLPMRLRIGIVIVLAVAIAPAVDVGAASASGSLAEVVGLELLLGAAVGWAAFLGLAAVRAAAVLVSEQAGFAFGGVVDPSSGVGGPGLRTLYGGLALFVFLAADLHHSLLRAMVDGMRVAPPGSIGADGVVAGLTRMAGSAGVFLMEAALLVAIPVIVVLVLAAVAQGVLARLFPELETVFFGFLVRTALAVAVIAWTLPELVATSRALFEGAVADGSATLTEIAR